MRNRQRQLPFPTERRWVKLVQPVADRESRLGVRDRRPSLSADVRRRQAIRATPVSVHLLRTYPRLPAPYRPRRSRGVEILAPARAIAAQSAVLPPRARPAPATRRERNKAC